MIWGLLSHPPAESQVQRSLESKCDSPDPISRSLRVTPNCQLLLRSHSITHCHIDAPAAPPCPRRHRSTGALFQRASWLMASSSAPGGQVGLVLARPVGISIAETGPLSFPVRRNEFRMKIQSAHCSTPVPQECGRRVLFAWLANDIVSLLRRPSPPAPHPHVKPVTFSYLPSIFELFWRLAARSNIACSTSCSPAFPTISRECL
ncbi:uncharacterized protein LAESUDRAFT_408173 [Laetiporus sulphureus 93-53]|uniref:Uncharacterized protein n=1 Tax=Laetiporus sulphureus 93-53 TaxID=1314785 RepID=A0A165C9I7_9APHY|nr:uncharacterized protein LAESUDRAFT_408173 [Laetiporus sulphureus 93-53]KZT02435.1 hypothetical protein LAESUDRAFT_408173 [Laetiporus sulphureus 93-53]